MFVNFGHTDTRDTDYEAQNISHVDGALSTSGNV